MSKNSDKDYIASDVYQDSTSVFNAIPVLFIKLYQKFLSPVIAARCIYHPSCSQYAVDAYHKYGFFKATYKMIWRIIRCNPWSKGGIDPA